MEPELPLGAIRDRFRAFESLLVDLAATPAVS